jgi:hypothetical protein
MKSSHPIRPSVSVMVREDGRPVRLQVRDVETASPVHLAWPGRGPAWRKAAEVLSEALHGRVSPDEASKAFVAAAAEAGALVAEE